MLDLYETVNILSTSAVIVLQWPSISLNFSFIALIMISKHVIQWMYGSWWPDNTFNLALNCRFLRLKHVLQQLCANAKHWVWIKQSGTIWTLFSYLIIYYWNLEIYFLSAIRGYALSYLSSCAGRIRFLLGTPGMVALDLDATLKGLFQRIVQHLENIPKPQGENISPISCDLSVSCSSSLCCICFLLYVMLNLD